MFKKVLKTNLNSYNYCNFCSLSYIVFIIHYLISRTIFVLEIFGESAFFVLEHLKEGPYHYKSSQVVSDCFKKLTNMRGKFNIDGGNIILERCKLLMKALSLRLDSMSSSDCNAMCVEMYRLELASVNWPKNQDLLFSLKKYTRKELEALSNPTKLIENEKKKHKIDKPKSFFLK